MTSTSLTDAIKGWKQPFDSKVLQTLKHKGNLTYIPVSEVIARLNEVSPEWSVVEADAFINDADPNFVIGKVTIEVTVLDDDGEKVKRRHIGYGGQQIKFLKNGSGTVDLGDEFKGALSDALKKAAQQLGIGLDLARSDEALAQEAEREQPLADDATITAIEAYAKDLDDEASKEFKAWWKDSVGKRLRTPDGGTTVTAEEAQGAILRYSIKV